MLNINFSIKQLDIILNQIKIVNRNFKIENVGDILYLFSNIIHVTYRSNHNSSGCHVNHERIVLCVHVLWKKYSCVDRQDLFYVFIFISHFSFVDFSGKKDSYVIWKKYSTKEKLVTCKWGRKIQGNSCLIPFK